MHTKIVKDNEHSKITIDEWVQVAENFEGLHITDKLKQQNPFTDEFIFIDVLGSGYWIPANFKYEGWPNDGSIIFSPSSDGIVFVKFDDINDIELNEIASAIGGKVIPHTIGG